MKPHEVIDYLRNIKSYQCKVNITTTNDRQQLKYEFTQFCDKVMGYRLELGSDRVQIYTEGKIYVNDLKNSAKYVLDSDFDQVRTISFIGEYIKLLYTNDKINYSKQNLEGKDYQLVDLLLPGTNRNLYKAVMYIDLKAYAPYKIIVFDNKGRERMLIEYIDFKANVELNKELFKVG